MSYRCPKCMSKADPCACEEQAEKAEQCDDLIDEIEQLKDKISLLETGKTETMGDYELLYKGWYIYVYRNNYQDAFSIVKNSCSTPVAQGSIYNGNLEVCFKIIDHMAEGKQNEKY